MMISASLPVCISDVWRCALAETTDWHACPHRQQMWYSNRQCMVIPSSGMSVWLGFSFCSPKAKPKGCAHFGTTHLCLLPCGPWKSESVSFWQWYLWHLGIVSLCGKFYLCGKFRLTLSWRKTRNISSCTSRSRFLELLYFLDGLITMKL